MVTIGNESMSISVPRFCGSEWRRRGVGVDTQIRLDICWRYHLKANSLHQRPRFRLAIIGAGLITRNAHLPTALSLPGVDVCALVDPVLPRAEELAQEYGLKLLVTADLDAIMGIVDGAIVATPNHTHREVAVPLLDAGISTFIEKPLATTVEEGQAILDAARRGNSKVAIGHYQRFLEAPRLLKTLLDQNYFGHVSRFCHQFGTPGGWPALSAYTLKRSHIGGGVLVVTGTHFLDRMLNMWGSPDDVELFDDSLGGPEAHCEGHVRYTSGPFAPLAGIVRYSKCAALPAGLVLETERGTVMLRDGYEDQIVLIPRDRPDLRHNISVPAGRALAPELDPGQRMLQDFIAACQDDRAPVVDGDQGLASLKLVQRFYQNRHLIGDDWSRVGVAR
jgi:predicted dehydrogenase